MDRSQSSKPFDISKSEVWEAWLQVKANRGAAGVDGVELDEFEDRLQDNLYRVWNRMASGSYFPPPVRAVDIPKPDGGVRTLGVPTVGTRVAQTVAAKRLEAACEPRFDDNSVRGSGPDGTRIRPWSGACGDRCWQRPWVVDLDIQRFFDLRGLGVAGSRGRVAGCWRHGWVCMSADGWGWSMPSQLTGTRAAREPGTPQGGPVSPVLANLFLHYAFDAWVRREWPGVAWERYADDVIVHCSSQAQAERVLAAIGARMGGVGLELDPDKTRIVYCGTERAAWWNGFRKFTFLGFEFRRRRAHAKRGGQVTVFTPAVSPQARKRMSRRVRSWHLHRRTDLSFADLAGWVNPVVRGWMGYYGAFRRSELTPLFQQINRVLVKWVRLKWRRFRNWQKLIARWEQVVTDYPDYFAHWRWANSL